MQLYDVALTKAKTPVSVPVQIRIDAKWNRFLFGGQITEPNAFIWNDMPSLTDESRRVHIEAIVYKVQIFVAFIRVELLWSRETFTSST